MAGDERKYPWRIERGHEPFVWRTLFPGQSIESVSARDCRIAMRQALHQDNPDVVAIVGYARPECLEALKWSRSQGRTALLLSETQEIDQRRVWWKEQIKRMRVRQFDGAVVGGPNHRDYLIKLGMPSNRITMGYNAVDNQAFASWADQARQTSESPNRPYFICAARFAPEKNLDRLINAYAIYRQKVGAHAAWDLVLCGDGPLASQIEQVLDSNQLKPFVHRPGFLSDPQAMAKHYALASAFVLPSLSEPWGLVVNEAAACGLPLLVTRRAGAARTLVHQEITGRTFDPFNEIEIAESLTWITNLDERQRAKIGRAAAETVADWGPDRFAQGVFDCLEQISHPFAHSVTRWPTKESEAKRTNRAKSAAVLILQETGTPSS